MSSLRTYKAASLSIEFVVSSSSDHFIRYVKYLAYNLDSLGKTADSIPESDGKLVVLIDLEVSL